MPFSTYKSLGETVKEFQITYAEANFITGVGFNVPDVFREDLQFMMREGVVDNAEMIAAQRLNENSRITVFGITSNGDCWQFGKLVANVFTLNSTFYTIQELNKLFAAVNDIFKQCEFQLDSLIAV